MARAFNGSSDYLNSNSSPITGVPVTYSAWVFIDTLPGTATNDDVLSVGDSASTTTILRLELRNAAGDTKPTMTLRTTASQISQAEGTTVLSTGFWFHMLGTVDSSGVAKIFYNGTNEATGATPGGTSLTLNRTTIGARTNLTENFITSKIAECAIWNRVLAAVEISALAKGYSPLFIRNGLVFYKELVRDINKPRHTTFLTATGTTVSPHLSKIIYPKRRVLLPTTYLYDMLNEPVINDGDYIISPSDPNSATCEVKLSTFGNPISGDWVVRYRYFKAGVGTLDFTLKLFQGTTEIASWSHTNISPTLTQGSQTLTTEQKAAITDRSNLRFRIIGNTP